MVNYNGYQISAEKLILLGHEDFFHYAFVFSQRYAILLGGGGILLHCSNESMVQKKLYVKRFY